MITGLGRGGAEATLVRLVLASRDDVVHKVISLGEEDVYGLTLRAAGIPVTALGQRPGWFGPRAWKELVTLLRDHSPAAVQTWMYHADLIGGLAARRAGIRNVIWGVRNLTLDDISLSTRTVVRASAWLSHHLPRYIVTPGTRARMVHESLGYDGSRFHLIPNGFDTSVLRPDTNARAQLRAEWGVSEDEVLLGCVARVHPQKDHANLMSALTQLPGLRCVLAGTGTEAISGPVIALGARDDIAAIMNAIDIHILPSASEAFPNVLAEAMACGTPCVTTDVGDAAEIVGNTGWIVPPHDSDALAAAIAAAVREFKSRRGLARARIVERFSIDRMVTAYRALWEDE